MIFLKTPVMSAIWDVTVTRQLPETHPNDFSLLIVDDNHTELHLVGSRRQLEALYAAIGAGLQDAEETVSFEEIIAGSEAYPFGRADGE